MTLTVVIVAAHAGRRALIKTLGRVADLIV
jgi:hypothetical protein